jgi:hypothetical protein
MTEGFYMSPDLDSDVPFPHDDDTDRFAVQRCPRCAELTTVPLSLATSHCAFCLAVIVVAPLEA